MNNFLFINLTPHDINIVGGAVIPDLGITARISSITEEITSLSGIPIMKEKTGELVRDEKGNVIGCRGLIQIRP